MALTPTDSFPHGELQPIPLEDKPTFANLKVIHQQLNANAMAIPSSRGGGVHGHLALVIPTAQFDAIPATIPWQEPVHPGAAPAHAAAATSAQITETNRAYKANLDEFLLYVATSTALKKLLLAAVPDTFVELLKDDALGYANVTTLQLLNHLDTTYGTVTPDDLAANLATMDALWSPTQPIEDLWNQIRACQRYAAPHDPISDATTVRSAIANLNASGVFTDALKDWRKKPVADQTWANLLLHFNKEDRERRRQLTASDAGYANAAKQSMPSAPTTKTPSSGATMIAGMKYCWTHGLNVSHDSRACSNPQTGHCHTATADNMQGGNCMIKRRPGERGLWKRPPKANAENVPGAANTTPGHT